MGFFSKTLDRLKSALSKTKEVLTTDVRTLFVPGRQIDDAFLDEMEEKLIRADMGVLRVQKLKQAVRERWRAGQIRNAKEAEQVIREQLLSLFPPQDRELTFAPTPPTVILVAGVNGAGKTTSIAKLAWILKNQMGKKVIVAASDTFRAAAVDQLATWADRIGVEIVKHKQGSDPAAVAYDACEAAKARFADVLIVDTAGRLHTQQHLMAELTKIRNVVARRIEGAPHEVLLVLDATTGQNAILQAQHFGAAIDVTGIILAKLDGTAKGGVVIAIKDQLKIPVKFVGLGETPQDIETFDPARFIEALFADDDQPRNPAVPAG
ncbi:MAG: signal recognition particle-docking protein FtsY [Phycisphaerae bacterium]|nr:signal recognition particle-docking protein FtsY [Phycisphaerae bacterium]MDW8261269.1 signal recognition particle-docking protein FtsY [Phycisphaerales bacterium]